MNRWKLAVPVVACVASLFAVGCTTREVVVERAPVERPAEVVVQSAPPPEQVEVVPVAPSTESVWIRGHWHWNGGQWIWRPGHYETRRVGYRWVPAHYESRGGAYYYVQGHWAR
jgi:hypothetical protein